MIDIHLHHRFLMFSFTIWLPRGKEETTSNAQGGHQGKSPSHGIFLEKQGTQLLMQIFITYVLLIFHAIYPPFKNKDDEIQQLKRQIADLNVCILNMDRL